MPLSRTLTSAAASGGITNINIFCYHRRRHVPFPPAIKTPKSLFATVILYLSSPPISELTTQRLPEKKYTHTQVTAKPPFSSMEDDFPYFLPDEILQQLNAFTSEFLEPLCLSPSQNPSSPLPLTDDTDSEKLLQSTDNPVADDDKQSCHTVKETTGVLDCVVPDDERIYDEISNDVFASGTGRSADEELILPAWCLIGQIDYNCKGCTPLREIVHANEFGTMKLMIHGVAGVFYHAMLDVVHSTTGFMQHYFSDLSGHSAGAVKRFLIEYGLSRQQEGQILISDSINEFYDALCLGMNTQLVKGNVSVTTAAAADHLRSEMVQAAAAAADNNTGLSSSTIQIPEPESHVIMLQKTGIAAQRERAEALTLEEISTLFHLPIAKASINLHLCTTALKKACRRHGVKRWPYRKVKSAEKKIAQLHKVLKTETGTAATMTEAELAQIKEERDRACEGFVGKIQRIEGWISEKKGNLRCQSGIEAEKTVIGISKLKEKIKRVMIKMSKKGRSSKLIHA